jgi:hypothetical protein
MLDPYIYDPIPTGHIRLLVLNPSLTSHEELNWSLQTVPLGSQSTRPMVAFEALSYTWGNSQQTYPLICDGHELRIHYNLHAALPYLARRPSNLPLWIDAVCINQKNETEKLVQIRLMSEIYRSASRVWVWLGIAEEPAAGEAIKTLIPKLKEIHEKVKSLPHEDSVEPAEFGLPGYDSPAWTALEKILKSPWFLRLWIVQEAALAREIACLFGSHVIDWDELDNLLLYARSLQEVRGKDGSRSPIHGGTLVPNNNVFWARKIYQEWITKGGINYEPIPVMLAAVHSFTNDSQCSEARDRVLAFLGFVGSDSQDDDHFNGNNSIGDLYCEFTHFLFHRDPDWNKQLSYDLLHLAIQDNKSAHFPSWCPDFHRQPPKMGPMNAINVVKTNIRASTMRGWSQKGKTIKELLVRGIIVDTVENLAAPFLDSALDFSVRTTSLTVRETFSFWLQILEWELAASTLASTVIGKVPWNPGTGDTVNSQFTEEDYWSVLVGSAPGTLKTELSFEDFREFRMAMTRYSSALEAIGIDRLVENTSPDIDIRRFSLTDPLFCVDFANWSATKIMGLKQHHLRRRIQ